MRLLNHPIFLLVVLKFLPGDAARILAIFPYQGKSHFVMGEQLFKGLAKRGHQVDVVSHFPLKKPFPNYTDIVSLEGTAQQLVNNMTLEFIQKTAHVSEAYTIGHMFGNVVCELLGLPGLQKLIKNPPKDPPYDLVITEIFGAHCYMAFGHLLNVPVIGVSTSAFYPWGNDMTGNPDNTAFVPNVLLGFSVPMNFWERLQNTVSTIYTKMEFNHHTSRAQDNIIKKYFGQDAPGVRELERSVALVLVNTHYSLNGVSPITPAVVEVGGLHVQDTGPEISPNLQKWLDESENGFIYFSFGSMMKIESMPIKVLRTIYESLAKIAPVRVLMKIAKPEELPPGLPKNVLTQTWISQVKVLKHKNIRAFVTHGGLMGTQEAVHHGVPLIGIPLFADQGLNMRTYVNKKIAVSLDYTTITTEKLDAALNTILNDPQYEATAKKVSAAFKDRPMSAMDTAIFWIEYVQRNGANALRSPVLDLAWWQLALLDVFGAMLLALLIASYFLIIVIKKLKSIVLKSDVSRASKSKKIS